MKLPKSSTYSRRFCSVWHRTIKLHPQPQLTPKVLKGLKNSNSIKIYRENKDPNIPQ